MELENETTLSEAAHELGLSWAAAWRLMLTGKLRGRRESTSGRWKVVRASVEELKQRQAAERCEG